MTKLSKPKLIENGTKVLFPQGFVWTWDDETVKEHKNCILSDYDDIVELWKLGQLRGAMIGVAATVVLAAAGIGIYKIVKAKKED